MLARGSDRCRVKRFAQAKFGHSFLRPRRKELLQPLDQHFSMAIEALAPLAVRRLPYPCLVEHAQAVVRPGSWEGPPSGLLVSRLSTVWVRHGLEVWHDFLMSEGVPLADPGLRSTHPARALAEEWAALVRAVEADLDQAGLDALGIVARSTRDVRFYGFEFEDDSRTIVFHLDVDGAEVFLDVTEPFVEPTNDGVVAWSSDEEGAAAANSK